MKKQKDFKNKKLDNEQELNIFITWTMHNTIMHENELKIQKSEVALARLRVDAVLISSYIIQRNFLKDHQLSKKIC